MNDIDNGVLDDVAFLGNALAPFFLQDPRTGDAEALLVAFSAPNATEAAKVWPFADEEDAARGLSLMVRGLGASLRKGSNADGPSRPGEERFFADDDLVWEYRRLFVGPGVKVVPPWGSVYMDRDCVVFGESTLELRAWMREHGVVRACDGVPGKAAGEKEPEDHIGLMLALMAWLAEHQPESLREYLSLHLLIWAGHYLDELAHAAEHPFYKGLAFLTRASLDGLQSALALEVHEPKFYR